MTTPLLFPRRVPIFVEIIILHPSSKHTADNKVTVLHTTLGVKQWLRTVFWLYKVKTLSDIHFGLYLQYPKTNILRYLYVIDRLMGYH